VSDKKNKPKDNSVIDDVVMVQDIQDLCSKILGTRWDCLTKEEWKEIEGCAFHIAHYPDILNK